MTLLAVPPQKYIYQGLYKVYWLLGVGGNPLAPTRAAINAGLDLTPALFKVGGFSVANAITEVSPVGGLWVEQRAGVAKSSASNTVALYDDKVSTVMRNTWLVSGTSGYVLLAPYGDVVSKSCDVWPVVIASASQVWDQVGMYLVTFAASAYPSLRGVMPA